MTVGEFFCSILLTIGNRIWEHGGIAEVVGEGDKVSRVFVNILGEVHAQRVALSKIQLQH